jgi:OOP family OmpA-OmpF porin
MALKHLLLGTALIAVSASAAQAEIVTPTGWYLSLAAGANWIQDGDFDYKSGGVVTSANTASWETGWAAAAAVGYDFGNHWRAELEVAYRHNDVDSICNGLGCSSSWEVWELSEMVNVLYDVRLGGNWSAAVGAGIGGNLVTLKPQSGGASDDDYVFAGQLIAQLAYQFADRWQLYADYHFMMMSDPEPRTPFFGGGTAEFEKDEHTLMLGIRFDLQSDHGAPPPREEAPPPPERPREFIVFFGFNKSNLTAEAQRVVHEAAEAARQFGSATILVVGHTDTSGSPSYNLRLSLRRASAVKAGLAHEGIAPDMVQTTGKGETELMVETGDGVKEPQNRRATISLH